MKTFRRLALHHVILSLAVLALSACAGLGVQAPKTFEDHIANAYTSLTAARDTSTLLAQNGKLSRKDFEVFINQCDSARESIELARELHKLDAPAGQERLDSAITILNALNEYLTKRQRGEAASPSGATSNVIENRRRITGIDDIEQHPDEGQRAGSAATAGGNRGAWD